MNDPMSVLLATTILAFGGLGLYMYKSSNNTDEEYEDNYNEEGLFGGNFWGLSNDNDENLDDYSEEEENIKPRKKPAKTQRNRKSTGTSRRKY
jgi:hypothetical protein